MIYVIKNSKNYYMSSHYIYININTSIIHPASINIPSLCNLQDKKYTNIDTSIIHPASINIPSLCNLQDKKHINVSNNYYKKYLKYKNKFLNLRKQIDEFKVIK